MTLNFESDTYSYSTEKTSQTCEDVNSKTKPPRLILDNIFAFPPNRETLGGTSYLLLTGDGNILIDSPLWNESNQNFCQQQGGVKWLFLTHRGGIAQQIYQIQQSLDCQIIIQEQEAYLLPNLKVISFTDELELNPECLAIWTPGHSPGSSCLYYKGNNGVLFTGRHLLPNQLAKPTPLKLEKTFHWKRQLQSVQKIRDRFSSHNLKYILPGANTGYLRGKGFIDYEL
jgi:glyoxylase-like metal-dependent hydrolase (beta-lactamase superfamily II)